MKKRSRILAGFLAPVCVFAMLFVSACKTDAGSGGNHQPSAATYKVEKAAGFDNTNGDFTISPATAEQGNSVTVKISRLNSGYEVSLVTVSGTPEVEVTEVSANDTYTFPMPARDVTVNVTFDAVGQQGPKDYAYNLPAANYRLSASRTSTPNNSKDVHMGDHDWDTYAQVQGKKDENHWFAVDLGKTVDIRAVRIVWGLGGGASGDFNGMVNYAIEVSNAGLLAADEEWVDIETVNNPPNTGTGRNDQNRVNTIKFGFDVKARYIRIRQLEGLDSTSGNDRPWTDWPSIATFEVYDTEDIPEYQLVTNKNIGTSALAFNIAAPVWKADAPIDLIGETDYAPTGAPYTAKLTGITGGFDTDNKYKPGTVYSLEFTLEIKAGEEFLFTSYRPTLYLPGSTPVASATTVTEYSTDKKQMKASYAFPATESNVISSVGAFSTLAMPIADVTIPDTTGDHAAAGSLYSASLGIQESNDGSGDWATFSGTTFGAGKYYRFNLTLTTKTDYYFAQNITAAVFPTIGNKPATGITLSADKTALTFTYTFDQTAAAKTVTVFNNVLNDSANSGLTVTAALMDDTTTGEYGLNDTVRVKIAVTGTSKKASIYTAELTSSDVSSFTFVPSYTLGDGKTSSPTRTRNIGGIGYSATANLPTTSGGDGTRATGEAIGQKYVYSATSVSDPDQGDDRQPANAWTFIMAFTMPDKDVTVSLKNTFRYDLAPGALAKATETNFSDVVKYSSQTANNPAWKAFNGEYYWVAADHNDRWVGNNGGFNNHIVIDLGEEYIITDAVIRLHSQNSAHLTFRVAVSNNPDDWTNVGDSGGNYADIGTDTDTSSKWQSAWLIQNQATNVSRYIPLFSGDNDGTEAATLKTILNGGIAPWPGTGVANAATITPSTVPLKGRYVKFHGTGQPINTGVGAAIWNFEIYGTPAD